MKGAAASMSMNCSPHNPFPVFPPVFKDLSIDCKQDSQTHKSF